MDVNQRKYRIAEKSEFSNKMRLTQRALDAGDSARFTSSFLASSFLCCQAESTPAPAPVTQTVSLLSKPRYKEDFHIMKDSPIENLGAAPGKRQSIIDTILSALLLSKSEVLVASLTGIATWLGFRSSLSGTLPYPCGTAINGELIPCGWTYGESWTQRGHSLFSTFSVPIVIILAMSAVFLLRAIRKDERYFSILGNLAVAWPLISFPLANLFSFYSGYCLPIGVGIALIAGLKSLNTKRNSADWIALLFSVAWLLFLLIYMDQWWNRYGD